MAYHIKRQTKKIDMPNALLWNSVIYKMISDIKKVCDAISKDYIYTLEKPRGHWLLSHAC